MQNLNFDCQCAVSGYLVRQYVSGESYHAVVYIPKDIPSNRHPSQKASTNNDSNHLPFEDINYLWIAENHAFMMWVRFTTMTTDCGNPAPAHQII